jgi:BirA family biotin operon repressor/biotin-[acetyl-CoA-carboxylase] ligase
MRHTLTSLRINNPFNAPVYHRETVSSTMDVSRELASAGEPHGTVIAADFQEAGRGRIRGRLWEMEGKKSLPFTILLRYPRIEDIPPALTLRVGLAVVSAIEDFAPSLQGIVQIKWPNDIMIDGKKAAGIACEADGGNVCVGVGINMAQKEFPEHLRKKATSIALAVSGIFTDDGRFCLLEKTLACLYDELQSADWRRRLEKRLYKKGEQVVFIEGAADSEKKITGTLAGIAENGELLIIPEKETQARSFVSGELVSFT